MNPFKSYLLLAFIALLISSAATARQVPNDNERIAALKKEVEPLTKLSLEEVAALVPASSGIHYIGCPNCKGGAQDMGVLLWTYGMGDQVKCRFCQMTFPNAKFPNNMEHLITAPSGAKQVYRYYQDKNGKTHYYEAHAWYERWRWIQKLSTSLAALWSITRDPAYADRAAVILGRFAQVFPDYAVRFDYPNRPVKFFAADQKWPYQGMQPYRGAKWYWWAYNDIPIILAEVYDELQKGYNWKRMDKIIGPNTNQKIIKDLLVKGYEHTAANPETYSNMSPGMYEDMILLGKIVRDPKIAADGLKRFQEFIKVGFFADGWWKEGTVSYHDQTINNLRNVIKVAQLDPATMPFYQKAYSVTRDAILPNGRKIPINDTWPYERTPGKPTDKTVSRLWSALGNAAIGTGAGKDQFLLNLNWSGNYGHSHYDNGSIILYAQGQELLSDLGYTHTKYRAWTIQTPSHNTVVIDQKGQDIGTMEKPATGRLLFYDDTDPHVKAIDLDASPAYGAAKTYRRRLVIVHVAPGKDYVLDRFDVEGGDTHDWFLHGNAEQEGTLELSDVTLSNNHLPAYAFLKDVQSGNADGPWTATWRYDHSGLRTHNLSGKGAQVFRFRSAAIRPAGEDDNKLDDFMRSGIMQRHSGGKSSFIALHEPFSTEPWIDKIAQEGAEIVVNYQLDGKSVTDRIGVVDGSITVRSTAGWRYSSGKQQTGAVVAYDNANGKWRLQLDKNVPEVDYVRLDLPGGSTRYYRVLAIDGKWLQLQDDPGFSLEGEHLKFYTFPHDEYRGALKYTLFEKIARP
ncbi:heparinase II/III family protein [Pedobacter heparinus]|uniref:heparinase II/III domain-containing protein n=1 Tax=Pedobacter heparinus TaxID=984 RepID=UPI00292EED8E|nr:heparinase II/III family protein [Pedobacter heparinus]